MPTKSSDPIRLPAAALLVVACLIALGLPVGTAGAAGPHRRGLIASPRPGRRYHVDTVPLVVRAGTEIDEFSARLNGHAVAGQFAVGRHRRRVLRASDSEGLRRGVNVLSVAVWDGEGLRREKVRFRVVGDEPLTGAGKDLRVPVGSTIRLDGKVGLAPGDPGVLGEDWKVVAGPTAGGGKPALDQARLDRARTMDPSFEAGSLGRYTVRLTARSGDGATTDSAVIDVVPPSWLMSVNTQVPATATDRQPGIEVGGTVYRAPWLANASGGSYAGEINGPGSDSYVAQWQVVVFERESLKEVWNRTYGTCGIGEELYSCREIDGTPKRVDFAAELRDLGSKDLVVVASHPDLGTGGRTEWEPPIANRSTTDVLDEIGFPSFADGPFVNELDTEGRAAGSVAGVGVPGLGDGTAQWIVSAAGHGMVGYLTPRPTPPSYFEFTPSFRPAFDTRSQSSCSASGECQITQAVGQETSTTVLPVHRGGFLVTAFDRKDLKKLAAETFMTSSDGTQPGYAAERTVAMAAFIEKQARAGALLMITSQHGRQDAPQLFDRQTPRADWAALEAAVASIGGTRDALNRASQALGGTYSAVGRGGLAEGEAAEAWSGSEAGGRLRGSLVQDRQSRFATTDVDAAGAPAEGLTRLALAPPSSESWPLSGDPGAERAIAYIGEEVNGLGSDPRASYVTEKITEATDSNILRELERLRYPSGSDFTEAQFTAAREELLKEIADVARVRTYLGELADPAEKSGEGSWAEADGLQAELKNQLEILKAEGKVSINFFSIAQTVFQLIGTFSGENAAAKVFTQVSASLNGLAGQMYSHDWAGSPNGKNEILAINLAKELRRQAELSADGIRGIGNIIVSDPKKLFELGEHAKCAPDQCGEKYADFAYTVEMADLAKASTLRARDRTIYETLVPASYPIWDTGLARNPDLTTEWFSCTLGKNGSPIPDFSPFNGATELTHAKVLDQLDPAGALDPSGDQTEWRTYLSVARSETKYGWAPEGILERMFQPVPDNVDASAGGLGIEAGAFMRKAHRTHTYEPGTHCTWGPLHPPADHGDIQ